MKLVYISHESGLSGAPRSMLDMILKSNFKCEVIVILPKHGDIEKILNEASICYLVIPFMCDFFAKNQNVNVKKVLRNNYVAAMQCYEILKKESIDIVHSNTSVENVGLFLAYLLKVPHIWHVRELLDEHYDAKYVDLSTKKRLFKASSMIVTVSQYVREAFNKKYNANAICIHNGIANDSINVEPTEVCKKNALMVGTIQKGKGQLEAIRAVEILRNRGIIIDLTVVGSSNPAYLWIIKRYIKEHLLENQISVLDYVDSPASLRNKMGISLTCSRGEALGRCTVEGMYAKQFVIGAESAGTTEVIGKSHERGFLYECGNPKDLADKIEEYLELKSEDRKRIIKNAYDYAVKEYSVEHYIQQIMNLYEQLLLSKKIVDAESIQKIITEYQLDTIDENLYGGKQISYSSLLQGRNLVDVIKKYTYARIAIYGMGNWGIEMYKACEKSKIEITAVFDRGLDESIMKSIVPFRKVGDRDFVADAIVVCVESFEKQIADELQKIYSCEIVMLSDILSK